MLSQEKSLQARFFNFFGTVGRQRDHEEEQDAKMPEKLLHLTSKFPFDMQVHLRSVDDIQLSGKFSLNIEPFRKN
jgi:hypothetical protein